MTIFIQAPTTAWVAGKLHLLKQDKQGISH
jgi:hypothetical protein